MTVATAKPERRMASNRHPVAAICAKAPTITATPNRIDS